MCYSVFNDKMNKNKNWLKEGFAIRNIIPEFTKSELKSIMENANFTRNEEMLFELRNNEHSLEECAEIMDCSISTINRINKKMKRKIIKVILDIAKNGNVFLYGEEKNYEPFRRPEKQCKRTGQEYIIWETKRL